MKYILLFFIICFSAFLFGQGKYINVNGTSELILKADQINFTVQIKVINDSVEGAKLNSDKYLDQLLKILKETGINKDDIDVSPITLGKNYEYSAGERKQNGYYTQVNITFQLRDISKYYELTDKLASGNNFEILNSSYDISDYETENKKAYENALTAAREKAEYMCRTLGLTLGDVFEIDETGTPEYPIPLNTLSNESSSEENPFGKVTIRRTVRVKFAIK